MTGKWSSQNKKGWEPQLLWTQFQMVNEMKWKNCLQNAIFNSCSINANHSYFETCYPLMYFVKLTWDKRVGGRGTLPQSGQQKKETVPFCGFTKGQFHTTTHWRHRQKTGFEELLYDFFSPPLHFVNSSWDNPAAGPFKKLVTLWELFRKAAWCEPLTITVLIQGCFFYLCVLYVVLWWRLRLFLWVSHNLCFHPSCLYRFRLFTDSS